jgi:hypothetical protein
MLYGPCAGRGASVQRRERSTFITREPPSAMSAKRGRCASRSLVTRAFSWGGKLGVVATHKPEPAKSLISRFSGRRAGRLATQRMFPCRATL